MKRAILWLNAREAIDWMLGFVIAAGGGVLLFIATIVVASIRRGNQAKPTWDDFLVLLIVLGTALALVIAWTACWRCAVAWAEGRPARAPETLAAPDPFAEAARREVEELTRES